MTTKTIICPFNAYYRIELDSREIDKEDPGNGTPAMVYGPQGTSATFECAMNEAELLDKHGLTWALKDHVVQWLEDQAEAVDEFIDAHS